MKKNFAADTLSSASPLTPEDLECIHRFTRKEVTAEEIYTFPVLLCDNEIDRDFERFTLEALHTLADLFVGKTGIFDHSMESRDQSARIYKAECIEDPVRKTQTGENYTFIRAMAYMPKTEKNNTLISEIDCGIKKEVSVGCAVSEVRCSVCGSDIRTSPCTHRKGEIYDGKQCHHILSTATDAYEWSFVAVPAQRNAGVTKSFVRISDFGNRDILKALSDETSSITLTTDDLAVLRKQLSVLNAEASLGKMYRHSLVQKAMRLGLTALPDMDGEILSGVLSKLGIEELSALTDSFSALARKCIPCTPQLSGADTPQDSNHAFII